MFKEGCSSCFRSLVRKPMGVLSVLALLLFGGALLWTRARDPFDRIWFTVKTPGHGKAKSVAVLPKTAAKPLPVIVYMHGSGGSLLGSGNELRQMAEMGLAVVALEYNQTNEAAFEAQFEALHRSLRRQQWANANALAWVGYSLGAQRQLSFLLKHPESQPRLLVRVGGGWVPELEWFNPPLHPASNGLSRVLILHSEQDIVFPLADAERTAAVFRTNGIPVDVSILEGEGHALGPNRELVYRALGEYCLTQLKGPEALANYRSIASWRTTRKPLWVYWSPALLWIAVWFLAGRPRKPATRPKAKLTRWELVFRCLAAMLAMLALGQTAFHLITPRLAVTDRTLAAARKHLIQSKQQQDFDYLTTNSVWKGQRLRTLLTHVELANYNRGLVNWKLDDQVYREFVLSPQIGPAAEGAMNWHRLLWESFYPRIRREQNMEAAAEIVVRHLRGRVTMVAGDNAAQSIESMWLGQIAEVAGFERLYVAALRSAGIPARLDPGGRAEFKVETGWKAAPRPLIESVVR